VFVVGSTSVKQTADKLGQVFAIHGLSVTLVSDNGPPFTSTESSHFMISDGITIAERKHTTPCGRKHG